MYEGALLCEALGEHLEELGDAVRPVHHGEAHVAPNEGQGCAEGEGEEEGEGEGGAAGEALVVGAWASSSRQIARVLGARAAA